jgi:hypothetical protein
VAADWDSSGTDAGADTMKISETSAAASADAYDIDPDAANYAAGNDPDIAYRNQGRADSPNGWGSRPRADTYPGNDEHGQGDYAYQAGEHDQPHNDGYDGVPDLWGDTDPDAANYADLDNRGTGSPGRRQDDAHQDKLEASSDADQPSQDQHAEADAEQTASPEQRIMVLEAENAAAKQRIADLEEKNADAGQQIADLKAELEAAKNERATRPDRIEPLPEGTGRHQDGETSTPDDGADEPGSSQGQDALRRVRGGSDERIGTTEVEETRWRRVTSAENVGAVSTLLGAADMAMHGVPGLAVALGATVIGAASWGQAKLEKHQKGKP